MPGAVASFGVTGHYAKYGPSGTSPQHERCRLSKQKYLQEEIWLLAEVLTWLGVAVVAGVAWALYAVGENAPKRAVQREEQATDE